MNNQAIHSSESVHVLPLRVYYEDTDAAGIVYYANYLKFAERGRSELMRKIGVESKQLIADHGVQLVVKNCQIEYFRPARLDDLIEVHTRVVKVGGASMTGEQRVLRGAEELVRIDILIACYGNNGKTARMPGELRSKLKNIMFNKIE